MSIEDFVAVARAEWPAWVGSDGTAFARFVEERLAEEQTALDDLHTLHASDLWLAYHAGLGLAPAVLAVEQRCFADLSSVLLARRAPLEQAEEVVQRLRHRLLVADHGERARILTYSGRGALKAWVRVAVVRAWLNMKREGAREERSQEGELADEATADLELELLKGKYRELFERAFLETVESLSPGARLLLKLHYLDRLSMEEVGKVLGVHRLTVLRRLERARIELSEGTKERLEAELRLGPPEVESVLRLIQSRLDVSLRHALGSSAPSG